MVKKEVEEIMGMIWDFRKKSEIFRDERYIVKLKGESILVRKLELEYKYEVLEEVGRRAGRNEGVRGYMVERVIEEHRGHYKIGDKFYVDLEQREITVVNREFKIKGVMNYWTDELRHRWIVYKEEEEEI